MNGWGGLFLAVRRTGCLRAGCNSARSPIMRPSLAFDPDTDLGEIKAGEDVLRDRLRLLLKEFAALDDAREPWRVLYPLREVLLLVTCATIAACDDFDDIVAWGQHHLAVLRRFSPFHHGIPGARWLRALVNRVDPLLFGRCFESWIAALWPNRHDLIAIDGKTARRTHDRRSGLKALHTLSQGNRIWRGEKDTLLSTRLSGAGFCLRNAGDTSRRE